MTRAIWNAELVAKSDHVVLVENRVYFPPDSIFRGRVRPAEVPSSYCHWKGDASYFDIVVDGEHMGWQLDDGVLTKKRG